MDVPPTRILVVDDDPDFRSVLCRALSHVGYDVLDAPNGRTALQLLGTRGVDLVITDVLMPEMEGVEFIDQLRRRYPTLPVVAVSGGGRLLRSDCLKIARLIGARATLAKPFDFAELSGVLTEILTPSAG